MKKIYLMMIFLIGLVICGCNDQHSNLNKQLATMIDSHNAMLPKMVDAETRLERLEKIKDAPGIDYIYTIINLTSEQIEPNDYQELKPDIVRIICNQPEFTFFVNNNIIMRYSYFSSDGKPAFTVTIQPALDCKH